MHISSPGIAPRAIGNLSMPRPIPREHGALDGTELDFPWNTGTKRPAAVFAKWISPDLPADNVGAVITARLLAREFWVEGFVAYRTLPVIAPLVPFIPALRRTELPSRVADAHEPLPAL